MNNHARRVLAASSVALSLVAVTTVAGAPSAQAAATTQRICNSSNSAGTFTVDSPYGTEWILKRSQCVAAAPKGSTVTIQDASYRVGYNLGPYSECRDGITYFVPWQKADTIYFRTYNGFHCEA